MLHGRLPPAEKDDVMRRFAAGDIDVLVATTVIEVGVDVPNATMMVIMDAERFGMSQLHQLRGRVGRGSAPGVCLLVTEAGRRTPPDAPGWTPSPPPPTGSRWPRPISSCAGRATCSAPARPAASTALRQLSMIRDREMIQQARADAQRLVGDDPTLDGCPELAAMVSAVIAEDSQEYLEKG